MERARQCDPLNAAALARLAFALLLSLVLHAVLLVRVEQGPRQPELRPVIRARLVSATTAASAPEDSPQQPVRRRVDTAVPAPVQYVEAGPVDAQPPAVADKAQPAEGIRLPVDLNYYTAAELDVYPVLTQPIRPNIETISGGWIRILTLIGETGQVDDAVVFDADPAGLFDAAVLDAVRRARFRPARRGGREVRSRVLIELRLGADPTANG